MPIGNYVLIVDPDRELVDSVQTLLKGEGYESVGLHDGEEAIKACEKELPKIILMEGLLPKLNGVDVAKKIRKLPDGGWVAILLVSAVYSGTKFRSQIKEAQIDDVLPKPFLPVDLISKLRTFEVQLRSRTLQSKPLIVDDLPTTGDLSQTPFIDIAFTYYSRKATGTLRLQSENTKKLVTFENGEPKFVVSNLERECLGQLLVTKGRLTEQQCKESIELMDKLKKRQGEALIQMGLIKPYELEEMLKQQAREKFCEIFGWRQGQYLFVPGKVFRKELTPVDLSIEQLCLRGIKEHYNQPQLEQELSAYAQSIPNFTNQTTFSLDHFKFATWDTKVIQLIRHKEPLSKILKKGIARELDVYHLFYALYKLGIVAFETKSFSGDRPSKSQSAAVPSDTPFDLLGVSPTAKDEEIQMAFSRKVAEYKSNPSGEYTMAMLKAAYEKIATLQGRRDYLMRTYEERGALPKEAWEVFRPDEFIEVGKRFLDKKDYASAKKVFLEAVEMHPEEGILFSFLGFSMFLELVGTEPIDAEKRDRARKAMMKGVHLARDNPETHYMLGRSFSMEKNYDHAATELQKALNLNPKHLKAASELRLVNQRLEKKRSTSFIKWKK